MVGTKLHNSLVNSLLGSSMGFGMANRNRSNLANLLKLLWKGRRNETHGY